MARATVWPFARAAVTVTTGVLVRVTGRAAARRVPRRRQCPDPGSRHFRVRGAVALAPLSGHTVTVTGHWQGPAAGPGRGADSEIFTGNGLLIRDPGSNGLGLRLGGVWFPSNHRDSPETMGPCGPGSPSRTRVSSGSGVARVVTI